MRLLLPPVALFVVLSLGACALPVPEGQELSDFVPKKELVAVELAQEGMSYFNGNRFVDAELKFRQALYLFPEKDNLRTNLAAALERTGQFDESLSIYRTLSKAHPASWIYKAGEARVLLGQQKFAQAYRAFEEAFYLAAVGGDPNASANYAKSMSAVAFRAGWQDRAACDSLVVLTVRPTRDEIERAVRLQIGAGHYVLALSTLDRYTGAVPALQLDPVLIHVRSLALIGLSRIKEAADIVPLIPGTITLDPATVLEIQLVRSYLSGKRLEPENLSEEQQAFADSLVQLVESNSPSMLYYPPELQAKAFEEAQRLEGSA